MSAVRKRKNKSKKSEEEGDELFDLTAGHGPPTDFFANVTSGAAGKKKGKGGKTAKEETFYRKKKNLIPDSDDDSDDEDETYAQKSKRGQPAKEAGAGAAGGGGIKTGPLIMLLIMFGGAIMPAVFYMGDVVGKMAAKNNVMGNLGYRLGLSPVPRKRVVSFYEKHAPEKIEDIPTILSKHYGEYPKLIKKLERKYGDYGYFIGWEEDEQAVRAVQEQLEDLQKMWLDNVWNRYAPRILRTAVNNIRRNLRFLYKK